MLAMTAAQRHAWMAQWRAAGPALERVRVDEMRRADLAVVADELEEALQTAAPVRAVSPASGLVEQQCLFHRVAPG